MMQGAIFLDRDGVLNVEGGDYVTTPGGLRPLPGALEALAAICRAGWRVFVYTNQAGVGRGIMSLKDLDIVHQRLQLLAHGAGGKIQQIYACPHHPDAQCNCRKPKPGMLLQAALEHGIDLARSYAVGDSPRDIAAAKRAGCATVLVLSGHTPKYPCHEFDGIEPDHVFADLAAFASWLIAQP